MALTRTSEDISGKNGHVEKKNSASRTSCLHRNQSRRTKICLERHAARSPPKKSTTAPQTQNLDRSLTICLHYKKMLRVVRSIRRPRLQYEIGGCIYYRFTQHQTLTENSTMLQASTDCCEAWTKCKKKLLPETICMAVWLGYARI